MANFKRKSTHRQHKGCGLCNPDKRLGNHAQRTKPKYLLKFVGLDDNDVHTEAVALKYSYV